MDLGAVIERRCPEIVTRWLERVASELGVEEMETAGSRLDGDQ